MKTKEEQLKEIAEEMFQVGVKVYRKNGGCTEFNSYSEGSEALVKSWLAMAEWHLKKIKSK